MTARTLVLFSTSITAYSVTVDAGTGQPAPPAPAAILDADVDLQLLGRSVAAIRTPRGVSTGFLVCGDALLTAPDAVTGISPDEIAVWFDEWGSAQPKRDSWPVREVILLPTDGRPYCAMLMLESRAGAGAGELYGFLGVRRDDPSPGEPLRVLFYEENGREKFWARDHLVLRGSHPSQLTPSGLFDRVSCDRRPGAPLLDNGGCVVAIDTGEQSISVNQLREWMPSGGSALCECQLPIEANDWYDQGGGRSSLVVPSGGGQHVEPPVGISGRRGGGGAPRELSLGTLHAEPPDIRRTADHSVFESVDPLPEPNPEEPILKIVPPESRDPAPDRGPRRRPPTEENDDPRYDPPRVIPEPGTAALLGFGALALIPHSKTHRVRPRLRRPGSVRRN